jgi:hypothetical protein
MSIFAFSLHFEWSLKCREKAKIDIRKLALIDARVYTLARIICVRRKPGFALPSIRSWI